MRQSVKGSTVNNKNKVMEEYMHQLTHNSYIESCPVTNTLVYRNSWVRVMQFAAQMALPSDDENDERTPDSLRVDGISPGCTGSLLVDESVVGSYNADPRSPVQQDSRTCGAAFAERTPFLEAEVFVLTPASAPDSSTI